MLCNKLFKVKSVEGHEIELLMPADCMVRDIQQDLGSTDPVAVKIGDKELEECATFLSMGQTPTEGTEKLVSNLKYLQCIKMIPDVPLTVNVIKMKEDWLRHNIPNPMVNVREGQGLIVLDQEHFEKAPIEKMARDRMLHAPKRYGESLSVETGLQFLKMKMDLIRQMMAAPPATPQDNGRRRRARRPVPLAPVVASPPTEVAPPATEAAAPPAASDPGKGILLAGGSVFCALHSIDKIEDYDLFFYGYEATEALELIDRVISHPSVLSVTRTPYAITFETWRQVTNKHGHIRHLTEKHQFILRLYKTKAQILLGFDLDSCRLGFDGQTLYATESAVFSLKNRVNVVDFDRMGRTYERRLAKYAHRGIAVYVPNLEYPKIRFDQIQEVNELLLKAQKRRWTQVGEKWEPNPSADTIKVSGLSRLIYQLYVTLKKDEPSEDYGQSETSNSNGGSSNVVAELQEIFPRQAITFQPTYNRRIQEFTVDNGVTLVRNLDYKCQQAISVKHQGPVRLELLVKLSFGATFPKAIEFKTIEPGEQTPGSFNPMSYSHPNEWYFGPLYS